MDKKQLIQQIGGLQRSRVITYLTSDRQGPINARVAMDIIPIISKQLRTIGKTENIDLFLYSAGGDTMVPWRLVSMIREYCDKFSVLIPYKAHSAATMIALGADKIVMSDLSELSPIDPSTANVFNPQDPQNPQIHPLALGNVNRTHNLIRVLAKRLLKSHKSPMKEEEITRIVDDFTEKLYSHQYFVGRKEAKEDLGVKSVVFADQNLSRAMTELYEQYKEEMELGKIWNPENELGANTMQNKKDYKIAYIESAQLSNYFELAVEYKKQQVNTVQQTPQGPIQIPQEQVVWRIVGQGWK